MLIIIGLGLEKGDLSVRALEAAAASDRLYIEQYTAFISAEYISFLKRETGKEIVELGRPDLEENSGILISAAKQENIAILVPGDPLIATTHHATLLDTAKKQDVECRIFHASSIYSAAVGESGLDVYKFGPAVTIAYWSDKYKPTSFLDRIESNIKNNSHTLVLLDLNQKEKKPMSLAEAMELLRSAGMGKEGSVIRNDLRVLIMGNVGKEDQKTAYVTLGETARVSDVFDGKMLVLIIPAEMSFAEQESISRHSR